MRQLNNQIAGSAGLRIDPQQLAELVKVIRSSQQTSQEAGSSEDAVTNENAAGVNRTAPLFRAVHAIDGGDLKRKQKGRGGPTGDGEAAAQRAARVAQAQVQNRGAIPTEKQTNREPGFSAKTSSNPDNRPTKVNRPQIPLGGAPPPPGVPDNTFDQARIRELTLEQIAGIVFNENRDVNPLPGRSTPEDLKKAKKGQAHAVINADRKYGKKRYLYARTAPWQLAKGSKESDQYQEALDAARDAYQEDSRGIDPTEGRTHFGNRFETDVGKNEESLMRDRILRDKHNRPVGYQKAFSSSPAFTHGGGKAWTLIFGEPQRFESAKQTPPKKTGNHSPRTKPRH